MTTVALEKSSLKMSPCDDRDPVGHARALRVARGERGQVLVVLDADRARAELLRRRDRDAAFAGAQVVDEVAVA